MKRHTLVLLSVTLLVLLFSRADPSLSQGSPALPDIPLTVSEWSNISRTNEPVTTGVPIPADATGYTWALFDGASEIPLQTTVLPGLKTPWILLDFQSTNAANQVKNYTLKQQTPTAAPTLPLVMSEDASQITVSTGKIQTQLSKSDFNLLDTVWLDSNSNQTFENGEKVVNPSAGNITASDVTAGGSGLVYSAVVSPTTGFTWEYQGTMRRTLRVDGSYQNPASTLPNHTLLNFTTRFTWYAGQTYVKVEHLIKNSYAPKERWVKLTSAKLNVGTSSTTDRITKSGDVIWSNSLGGTSVELLPTTLEISDEYNPNGTPPVGRVQQTLDIDANGGMIIGDLSYHGATVQVDFATGLSAGEKTRRTTATKDPMIALAPENQYSDLSAFGAEHFGTYQDEKDTYTKWGWTWPTPGNQWSEEHNRPRLPNFYPTWSTTEANYFEADELWQNIMMLSRVRIPYYLDRLRTFARFWNWEWMYRSDNYDFNGSSWRWFYGNGIDRTPAIQPTLTTADSDFVENNIKLVKSEETHLWNGGSIDYYYLTGDKDSLQAAIDLAEQCKLTFYGPNYNHTPANTSVTGTGSRGTIRCLYIFTRTWEATNDPQWKTAADGMLPFFLQSVGYDSRGFFYSDVCGIGNPTLCAQYPGGKFYSGFPTAVAVDSLYRYYLLTNNQSVKTQLLQIAQFTRDNAYNPTTGFGGTDYVIDSPNPGDVYRTPDIYGRVGKDFVNTLVIGYRLTGDSSYLAKAKLAWGRGTKGIEGSEYATDSEVGRWENSLQAWQADSGLFPEGGDLTYASFLFNDVARDDTSPPTGVGNASPTNGTIGVSITPTLTALTATDQSSPVSYYMELYQGNTCTGTPTQTRAYATDIAWTPSDLLSTTTFSWRNKARDSVAVPNESAFGSCATFVTECVENWSCSDWSVCSGGQQSRTCTELNNCGNVGVGPPLSQACIEPDSTPPAAVNDLNSQ